MKYSEAMHANKEFDEKTWNRGSSANEAGGTDNPRQQGLAMEDAIYAKSGAPTGFHDGKIIYNLQGQPVGRLRGSQVYCMGGHYVGELKNGLILDKSNRGSIPAHNHARRGAPGNSGMQTHGSQRSGRSPRQ